MAFGDADDAADEDDEEADDDAEDGDGVLGLIDA